MAFKRAEWHSGLTYRQRCDQCKALVQYDDYALDFRPWYADGFVYCPRCKNTLRHNENYAILNPASPSPAKSSAPKAKFCTQCGNSLLPTDKFCCQCGSKCN